MIPEDDLLAFLQDVKNAEEIIFVPREKNRRTVLMIGLTVYDQDDMIRNLTKDEYYCGPEDDHDLNKLGKIWVFKHNHQGHSLYNKLKEKITGDDGKSYIKCMSGHIDGR